MFAAVKVQSNVKQYNCIELFGTGSISKPCCMPLYVFELNKLGGMHLFCHQPMSAFTIGNNSTLRLESEVQIRGNRECNVVSIKTDA